MSQPPYMQPYQYGGYARPDAPGATASLALGIVAACAVPFVCCCGLGELVTLPCGILAVVFGISATQKISASHGALGGSGRATAGITIGGSALAVGLVLLAVVLIGNLTGHVVAPSPTPSG